MPAVLLSSVLVVGCGDRSTETPQNPENRRRAAAPAWQRSQRRRLWRRLAEARRRVSRATSSRLSAERARPSVACTAASTSHAAGQPAPARAADPGAAK